LVARVSTFGGSVARTQFLFFNTTLWTPSSYQAPAGPAVRQMFETIVDKEDRVQGPRGK
jgi:hypothetical protein